MTDPDKATQVADEAQELATEALRASLEQSEADGELPEGLSADEAIANFTENLTSHRERLARGAGILVTRWNQRHGS